MAFYATGGGGSEKEIYALPTSPMLMSIIAYALVGGAWETVIRGRPVWPGP